MSNQANNLDKGYGSFDDVLTHHVESLKAGGVNPVVFRNDMKSMMSWLNHTHNRRNTRAILCSMLNQEFRKTWDLYSVKEDGEIDAAMITDKSARELIADMLGCPELPKK